MTRVARSGVVVAIATLLVAVASAQPGPDPIDDDEDGVAGGVVGGVPDPGTDPGTGTGTGPGTGSADPSAGSGADPGTGTGTGTGTGSAPTGPTGPTVIQPPTDAMAPEVNASASPTVVQLGGRFTVFVTAKAQAGVELNLREPVELGGSFEVRKKVSEDRTHADGTRTREWQLDVVAWDLGDLTIPPIAVTYTAFGRVGQVQTNAVRVRVDGVLGDVVDDPKALRGLQPPTALVSRDWFWLWVGGAAAGGLALLVAALWWRRRRRRRVVQLTGGVVAAPQRLDMTGERALLALLQIEASGVLERAADRKRGYAEMGDVLRDYLGARYRVATRDLTSSELSRRLGRIAPAQECALVDAWMEGCDLVKYGGLRVTTAEARRALDDARALVVTTTALADPASAREVAA